MTSLRHNYVQVNTTDRINSEKANTTLRILFHAECCPGDNDQYIPVGLPPLEEGVNEEHWTPNAPIKAACSADKTERWFCAENWALIALWRPMGQAVATVSERAYHDVFHRAHALGFPFLQRVWNYLPNINQGAGDKENYKQFCLGRKQAFDTQNIAAHHYPAASALGNTGEQLVIYALCSYKAGVQFENPEQLSAYRYPREYGPQSPSFARASLMDFGKGSERLYLSGTASIVGHETMHANDPENQTHVTINNLEKLFMHVAQHDQKQRSPQLESIKVYVRQPEHLPLIKRVIQQRLPKIETIYLRADICRSDLLVEIDGYCSMVK